MIIGLLEQEVTYKPESYAEHKACRAAEVNGFEEALNIPESETAFVQTVSLRYVSARSNLHLRDQAQHLPFQTYLKVYFG